MWLRKSKNTCVSRRVFISSWRNPRMRVLVCIVLCSLLLVGATCSPADIEEFFIQSEANTAQPTDYILVIDRSGSMRVGDRFAEAQIAAQEFVSITSLDDRIAIIGFDNTAEVYSPLDSDKDAVRRAIQDMPIGDWTRYEAALTSVDELLTSRDTQRDAVVVFLSDGRPDESIELVDEALADVVSADTCLFAIAYSQEADEQARTILRSMASRSQQASACGEFFAAREGSYDLRRIYRDIYSQTRSSSLVEVNSEVTVVDQQAQFDFSFRRTFDDLDTSELACFDPDVQLTVLQDGQVVFEESVSSSPVNQTFNIGSYTYVITAIESCGGSCGVSASSSGSFEVARGPSVCGASFAEISERVRADSDSSLDAVFVLDNSGSMAGAPLREARRGIVDSLDAFGSDDRFALVSFSSQAFVHAPLSSSQSYFSEQLDGIVAESSTNYLNAFSAVSELLSSSRADSRAVIFLSDGRPSDSVGVDELRAAASSSFGDACVYAIGYGERGVFATDVLSALSEDSLAANGCGLFSYSSADARFLSQVLGTSVSLSKTPDLRFVDEQISSDSGTQFEVSARLESASGRDVPSTGQACIPPAEVWAVSGDRRFPLRYQDGRYVGEVSGSSSEPFVLVASLANPRNPSQSLTGIMPISQEQREVFRPLLAVLICIGIVVFAKLFMRRRSDSNYE